MEEDAVMGNQFFDEFEATILHDMCIPCSRELLGDVCHVLCIELPDKFPFVRKQIVPP